MTKKSLFCICILIAVSGMAQEDDRKIWIPIFENNMPSRFLSVKLERKYSSSINSISSIDEIGDGSSKVNRDRILSFNLKFPVISKSKFVITAGVKYFDEELNFDQSANLTYPLYVSLEDRNLKNLGGSLNGVFHLKDNRSIIARSSFALAGDFYRSGDSFNPERIFKFSFAVGYGIKKDPNTYYAFGVYWGYTFGVPSVYPAAAWFKRFNNGVGIDALLPQSVKLWKKVNDNFFVFGKSRIAGNSYTIKLRNSILDEAESLQLRKSSVISTIGLTYRLNKWLWLEAEGGLSNSLNFNLSETNFKKGSTLPKPNKDYLIKSSVASAPYASISLFLSPPKTFLDKRRK